jgi:hypothetical protein
MGGNTTLQSGKTTILAGADTGAYTVTDNTRKTFNLVTPAYDTDEEPVSLLASYQSPILTSLVIGNDAGYGTLTGRYNSLTEMSVKLGSSVNTLYGTERLRITYDTSKFSNVLKTTSNLIAVTGEFSGNVTVNRNIGFNQVMSDWYRGMYQGTIPLFMEISSTGNGHEWHSKDTNDVETNGFSFYTRRTGQGVNDSLRYRMAHSQFMSEADSNNFAGTINGVAQKALTYPMIGWLIQTNIDSTAAAVAANEKWIKLSFESVGYPTAIKTDVSIAYRGYYVAATCISREATSTTQKIDTVFMGNRAGKVYFYVKVTGSAAYPVNPVVTLHTVDNNIIKTVKDTARPANVTALWNSQDNALNVVTPVIKREQIVTGQLYKANASATVGYLDSTGIYVVGDSLKAKIIKQQGVYAEIHLHDNATAQNIPTGTTYTKCTLFNGKGLSSNCTVDTANDKITATITGKYMVVVSCNFSAGTNGVIFKGSIFVNNVEQDQVHFVRKIGNAGDVGSASMSGIISVTAGQDIDLRFRHDNAGTVTITPEYCNMSINYLGD